MVGDKLKSRRGASIIIALLVLLICVTAGTAALTAAGANAGRYTHMRADQQRYLAVASAARLVRSELCGGSFSAQAVLQENRNPAPAEGDTPAQLPVQLEMGTASYTGTFASWLSEDVKAVFQATAIPESWYDQAGLALPPQAGAVSYSGLGLQVGGSGDEPLLGQVKWSLTLGEDYALTARFWLEDDGASYYPTVLTIPAQVEETLSEPVPDTSVAGQRWTTTKTVMVTWPQAGAVITQG